MNKPIVISTALLALLPTVHAGLITVTTAPSSTYWTSNETAILSNGVSTNITITNQCVPISKYDATHTGVTFNTTYTLGSGSVTQWQWNFANASSSTSDLQTPTITFLTNSYGLANACSVGVTHLDSNGIVCSADTASKLTIPVNVIKPSLIMNTSSTPSTNDTSWARVESALSTTLTNGYMAQYMNTNSGYTQVGCPYEYVYSVLAPVNSGAVTNNMAICELNSIRFQYYQETNNLIDSNGVANGGFAFYNPAEAFNYTTVGAPTNPIMYAVDVPGVDATYTENKMQAYSCNFYQETIYLVSYPLYNDPTAVGLDTSVAALHTFVCTCTSGNTNGAGPYIWAVTY